ncbi:MAG: lysine--tRNA ligase [Candidatus Methanofastidiosia archaeon]
MSELFWADKSAQQVIDRDPDCDLYVTECGLGASGIPHVGSVGDGIRSYVVALAIKDKGKKSIFQAYSDDRDGLRKIPYGFPSSLKEYVGNPVSHIPDPFGCHKSFGEHISSLLTDAFDKIELEYKFQSSDKAYNKGLFDDEMATLMRRYKEAGAIIKEVTGQEKYLTQYPYFSICKECGKIYTTRVTEFNENKNTVKYVCDGEFIGKNSNNGEDIIVKGCGYEGIAPLRNGKLAWKVEFAARWNAFNVAFEAFGKDILESVKVNDIIGEKILSYKRPVHAFYEMFVERGGSKISKSKGNVFTPQRWLNYGPKESLILLMLKRLAYSRVVDLEEIPKLTDEVSYLQDIYFNKVNIKNEKERKHLKRLYEYVKFLKIPSTPELSVPYMVIVNISSVLPEEIPNRDDVIISILQNAGKIPQDMPDIQKAQLRASICHITAWLKDAGESIQKEKVKLDENERLALDTLCENIGEDMDGESIQNLIFSTAQDNGIKPANFFKLIYTILLGVARGPRAGNLIKIIGVKRVKEILKKELEA